MVTTILKFASCVIPGVIKTSFEFKMSDESKSPEAHATLIVAQRQSEVNAYAAVAAVQAEVDAPSWYLEVP